MKAENDLRKRTKQFAKRMIRMFAALSKVKKSRGD